MVNMNVPYARPCRALLTLRDEVYAAYRYTPRRASEFVTGYKSPSNFTGHNADNHGVVMAVDIFTDDQGNLPEAQGRELAEKLRLIGKRTNRFQYLIHDMCPTPGVAWPRIASANTGWEWVPYEGESPHTDHIHISMCDLYWGDPAPISASVYDSTAAWGISSTAINPAGNTGTIIQEDSLSAAEVKEIKDHINAVMIGGYTWNGKSHPGIGMVVEENQRRIDGVPLKVWQQIITRNGQEIPAIQELADAKTNTITAVGLIYALTDLVTQLSAKTGQPVDMAAVQAAAKAGAEEALSGGVDVNVTVAGGGANG